MIIIILYCQKILMNFIFERITYLFDPLHHFWEHEKVNRKISLLLVIFFLVSLVLIELKRNHLLPPSFALILPDNHFHAVSLAFTVVLILEVISLIFTIPCSFSRSVGKQFEILSLILMRNAFKALSYFPEPITYEGNEAEILKILSDGFGALLIFGLLGVYYITQSKSSEESMKPTDIYSFVAAKKGISLILLGIFAYMGLQTFWLKVNGVETSDFLYDFYTLLILTDILIVLLSQCYQPSFYAVFRNSGFALATLIVRFALAAPAYYNVLLGAAAACFSILLTLVSSKLFQQKFKRKEH